MDRTLIARVLENENLNIGLNRYLDIMKCFQETNVSTDRDFQRKYNNFYKIRQRPSEFYRVYYDFMEDNRKSQLTFEKALIYLYERFGACFASFSSKMVATIDPSQPVWDQYVLQNIGIKAPRYGVKDRINKTVEAYSKITEWYKDFLLTKEADIMLRMFNERFPGCKITDIKKIDLMLWQMRVGLI